jgi:peptidase S24-like protein
MREELSTSTGVRTYIILKAMPTFESYKIRILRFYRQHRRMPSYGEIMRLVGFKSKFAVIKLVAKLVEAGIVAKDAQGRLVPRSLAQALPVLGYVEAGWPSPAEEETIDTISLDEYLIKDKEATFIARMKGDSMTGVGIMPGYPYCLSARKLRREPNREKRSRAGIPKRYGSRIRTSRRYRQPLPRRSKKRRRAQPWSRWPTLRQLS